MYDVSGKPETLQRVDPIVPLEIELAIPCSRCGYTLSGLKTDGKCPECAAPIAESVRGERLEFAAPGFVRVLWLGAVVTAIAVAVQLVCTTMAFVPTMVMLGLSIGPPPRWLDMTLWFAFVILPAFSSAAALAGWWLLTTPDPARHGTPGDARWRVPLRAVIGLEAACWIMLVGLGMVGLLSSIPPAFFVPLAAATGFTAPFAILAHAAVSALFIRGQSARLSSDFVGAACGWQLWASGSGAASIVACILAVNARSEGWMLMCVLWAYLSLAALACVHIMLLGMIRREARGAMDAQSKSASRRNTVP